MSFGRRARVQSPLTGEATAGTIDFAPNLLEAFIPGYGIISKFILQTFGFDIGLFVSTGLILVTFGTTIRFIFNRTRSLLLDHGVSSIHILEYDDMFDNVLSWIGQQRVGKQARTLKAVSKSVGDDDEDELEDNEELFRTQLFHTGRMAKVPPKYEPYFGSYYFFRRGRLFVFERGRRERGARNPWDRQIEEEHVTFKTVGWSTQPIKNLLRDIKTWAAESKNSFTVIRRPSIRERGRQGNWARQLERPSRPMETVVLDTHQKARLIADVHEYLLPSTRKWYARRGIPYRRGYLFHGPPGTGKSSLSFALAGLFGLDVYLISLLDPTITENDLLALFNNLPRRCIVLLEDIDAAGLKRHADNETVQLPTSTATGFGRNKKSTTVAATEELAPSGISMSGLLNAIDGVSSHEGHVLVMTSNFPERLDEALIRPGRVDMKIEFTLATKHQIREIFVRMYSDERPHFGQSQPNDSLEVKTIKAELARPLVAWKSSSQSNILNAHTPKHSIETTTQELLRPLLEQEDAKYTRAQLHDLANEFVDKVPENTFSPAEVQNFLIPRKKDPWQAIAEVKAWEQDMLKFKMEKEEQNGHSFEPLGIAKANGFNEKVKRNGFPPTPTTPNINTFQNGSTK